MFKNKYYYIIAGLSDLILDQSKVTQSLADFKAELAEHLSQKDYKLVEKIFLNVDNHNILNILQKKQETFNELGKYERDQIEQEIKDPQFEENFLNIFISAYKSETPVFERISWEDQLVSLYYEFLSQSNNDFLKSYYSFNLHINNIITALNARKHKIKNKNIYVGDNPVVDALKQSTLKDFGLSAEFPVIEQILNIFENEDLVKREKSTDMLKWNYMEELNTFNYFTIEIILSYIIKLQMAERWIKLDEEEGEKLFEGLIKDLNKSFSFSEKFEIVKTRRKVE